MCRRPGKASVLSARLLHLKALKKEISMTKTFIALLSIIILAGCSNTFDGAGRDVENAGEWVQDTF